MNPVWRTPAFRRLSGTYLPRFFCKRRAALPALVVAGSVALLAYNEFEAPGVRHGLHAALRCSRIAEAAMLDAIDYKWTLTRPYASDEDRRDALKLCHTRSAIRVRQALLANGGVFIKLGQHASSLLVLPYEWRLALRPLQDQCPASSYEDLENLFVVELGSRTEDIFESFDPIPIGVASLAQVHKGRLRSNGRLVAVKVQHPHIEEFCEIDMDMVEYSLDWIKYWFPEFEFTWLSDEMRQNLPKELDFIHEARNARQAAADFKNVQTSLHIPEILLATKRVLIMEFINGGRVDDLDFLNTAKIDRNKVSLELSRIFSRMLHETGFFHADAHPGNILIRPAPPASTSPYNFEICLLDHGLYFQLSDELRINYAKFILSLMAPGTPQIMAERQKYAQLVGNIGPELYPIFEAALTGRANLQGVSEAADPEGFMRASSLLDLRPQSEVELALIRNAVVEEEGMLLSILDLLRQIPRRMLMVLKVNDLTRNLDDSLQTTHSNTRIFLVIARYCASAVWEDTKKHLLQRMRQHGFWRPKLLWNLLISWWDHQQNNFRLFLAEMIMDIETSIATEHMGSLPDSNRRGHVTTTCLNSFRNRIRVISFRTAFMKVPPQKRRPSQPAPQVAELIQSIIQTPNEKLEDVLGSISTWSIPRSDMGAWIDVLDKFDTVLEDLVRNYALDTFQTQPFSTADKSRLMSILNFLRLLFENATNRKVFSSYDRLNYLLFSTDLEVLLSTQTLLLRPAYQYSSQASIAHTLSVSITRLQTLVKRWPQVRECGLTLVDLVQSGGETKVESLPSSAREVEFRFFRPNQDAAPLDALDKPSDAPSSSTHGTIVIREQALKEQTDVEIVSAAIASNPMSTDDRFELLFRVRIAQALQPRQLELRRTLVTSRLLSIAIFGHTQSESQANSSLFLYEPDLLMSLAELLRTDSGVPYDIQSAAVSALDGMGRYRNKMHEVLTAVNAGVNHGILMSLLRKTSLDLSNSESSVPPTLVETLLSFVSYIASHATGGNMVVSGGVIPLLIQLVEMKSSTRLSVVTKTLQLLDNVLYSFSNAFQLFCNARGVEVLVDRIAYEVDSDMTKFRNDRPANEIGQGGLPTPRASILKHLLRSVHRMMQNSGTSEGLRGLIDSTLLTSIQTIMKYRALFGPSVLPLAINIMATFIHSEPTSLATIQEMRLPETFYRAIETGIEPAIEVIQAIPNAINALCLNEVGRRQLLSRPSIIPNIMSIFISERHSKVLLDKENAVLVGTAVDELIRHHPELREPVFDALTNVLSKVEDMGYDYSPPESIRRWYFLLPPSDSTGGEEVVMNDPSPNPPVSDSARDARNLGSKEANDSKAHENLIVSFIDGIFRFLEGLFQHPTHCHEFITSANGLQLVANITKLPCLPFDFANGVASDSMVQVVRSMMDSSIGETLEYLLRIVNESARQCGVYWREPITESKLAELVMPADIDSANQKFRNLVTLHIRISLLSDVFATAGYAHSRSSLTVIQTLMTASSSTLPDLGAVHRAFVLEKILLKSALASKGIDIARTPSLSPVNGTPAASTQPLPSTDTSMLSVDPPQPHSQVDRPMVPDAHQEHNAAALKHISHNIPASLAPFFVATVKMFSIRRSTDNGPKAVILQCAKILATIVEDHLAAPTIIDSLSDSFAYYNNMIGAVTDWLVDSRASGNVVHTIQLHALYKATSLQFITRIGTLFQDCINRIASINPDNRSEVERHELATAYGSLRVLLRLVHTLVSSKPLFESGQTILVSTKDKKDTDPDYFDPHTFLVQLRLACLPFLKSLWQLSWLPKAPLTVCRAVALTVLQVVSADNEEMQESTVEITPSTAIRRAAAPDAERVRQLTDMGFPASAAERALVRTHNNVTAAAEFLLAHPVLFPPDPPGGSEPSEAPNVEESEPTQEASTAPKDSDSAAVTSVPEGKGRNEWRKELNESRAPLLATVPGTSLKLIDEHLPLIFELQSAFTKTGENGQQSIRALITDIKEFSPQAFDVHEQPLSNRCRLLALILNDAPSTLSSELRTELMDLLLALLLSNPSGAESDHPTVPSWVASHLLLVERLLELSEEPVEIVLPKDEESVKQESLSVGPAFIDARSFVFDFCFRLLAAPGLGNDEFLAVLRLYVFLTRDHATAKKFVERNGLSLIFTHLQSSSVSNCSSYIAIILRHLVEDATTLSRIMKQGIRRFLLPSRSRGLEVSSFARSCSSMALRDPQAFIFATREIAQLDSPFASLLHVRLKEDTSDSSKNAMNVDPTADDAQMNHENLDSVVHFLVSELMRSTKEVNSSNSSQIPAKEGGQDSHEAQPASHLPTSDAPQATENSDQDNSFYPCFLMQCLTELLFSYESCKVSFLSYSPKRKANASPTKDLSKYRSVTLNFLLNDLISFGTINPKPHSVARARIALCNWAMSVVVALCIDTQGQESKEVSSELNHVRKFTLDAVNRAIKDPTNSDSIDVRYGRLLALTDLCYRLLTVRFNNTSRKANEESPTHLAKVMLDKAFVATLTNTLADVDLTYPNIRVLIAAVLRPLEHLSKVSNKISRITITKDSMDSYSPSPEPSESDSSEDDGQAVNEDNQTLDVYRNSSLGIFSGDVEENQFDEEMDDDEEEEGDVQMEYGDETDSENTSQSDEESTGESVAHDGPVASGEWDPAEEDEGEDNDGEDAMEDVEEDEEDENGDDMDGDEEEMLWQDVHVNGEEQLDDVEDEGEEVDDGPIHTLDGDDEPEDAASDEEFRPPAGLMEAPDLLPDGPDFGFGALTNLLNGVDPSRGLYMHSRSRNDDGMHIFGRTRNGPAPPREALIHPLLLDNSTTPSHLPLAPLRSMRPSRNVLADERPDLIQTIEELIGNGGAVQLLQQVIRSGHRGPHDTIQLDVPGGALVNLAAHGIRRDGAVSASLRVERAPRVPRQSRDLEPLLTLQRWAEEVKIVYGDFVSDRVAKLANHVALALIPAALESARLAKINPESHQEESDSSQSQQEEVAPSEEQTHDSTPEAEPAAEPPSAVQEPQSPVEPPQEPVSIESEPVPNEVRTEDHPMEIDSVPQDSEMVDATNPTDQQPSMANAPSGPDSSPSGEAGGEAAPSNPPNRIMATIHGNPVDITDTGIDPAFLEALPDDMREEVLNQHVRDQRAARIERPPDSQISVEFLDALPADIRAEIIQQEAAERSRQRAEPAIPADIDPASFIASLDPTLRQAVLMEQDDGFIQTLPSHMIAEVGTYREGQNPIRMLPRRPYLVGHESTNPSVTHSSPRKHSPQRDVAQLLDRGSIAILVRLLFFPQVSRKNLLFRVLMHLCENSKTRVEILNLLIHIIHDGTGDLAAVDKSFSQMSVRGVKPAKSPAKLKSNSSQMGPLPVAPAETLPDVVAQRCLEALTFIVGSNDLSSIFFLTEHDVPATLRRGASKKGKGKERQAPSTHYPLVVLLSLLDKPNLLKTPAIAESLVGLLATITRSLSSLEQKSQEQPDSNRRQEESQTPRSTGQEPTSQEPAPGPEPEPGKSAQTDSSLLRAPEIPPSHLRMIVNILTVGDCTGRTFQQSLSLIQNLSYIPGARDAIGSELKSRAQDFAHGLLPELDEFRDLVSSPAANVSMNSATVTFTSSSATQAKLLRVLKTIDYMYEKSASKDGQQLLRTIYESFDFQPLWQRLGQCLSKAEEHPDTQNVASVLLPLIEALMVVCKYVGATSRTAHHTAPPKSPSAAQSVEDLFVTFTDAHRRILNSMVRNNPSLMSGSFSLLVHNPRALDFDNKRNFFNQQLHKRPHTRDHFGTLQLNIRRARVFEDSFQYLLRKSGDQIKYGKLSIRFYDEEGIDAGGVTREWFQILARQMFDPNNALFQPCPADRLTYQPNKDSWVNPEHLSFFKFVGRVIGKAIYDGRLMDAYFARSVYRQLLGKPVDYKDVEWVDPEYYSSLCWILENDPSPLDLTFSVESDEFGVNKIIPLKEGGEAIPVTQENKKEFVQLSANYRLVSSIKQQINHLCEGFYDIVPKELVTIFNEQELELLISGTPDIEVDEWRAATEYNGYTSSDPNIVWWWRALKSFNRDERAKVLSFATGTSRVPLGGFTELQGVQGVQKFSIHKAYGESDRLPQAHTCFNQIDLPQYSSYEMLRQQLLLAINEGGEGFGFA